MRILEYAQILVLGLSFLVVSCGAIISTPEKDAQDVVNVLRKNTDKGRELYYKKLHTYASVRGGREAKRFANWVTIKIEQFTSERR